MPVSDELSKRTLRRPLSFPPGQSLRVDTPLGVVALYAQDELVDRLLLPFDGGGLDAPGEASCHPQILKAAGALSDYFERGVPVPDLPLAPAGSTYCQEVWRTLGTIPFGQTVTYGELAKMLSSAPRAVAQACRRNPIPLLIPCHRVVAANCAGGFAGAASGPRVEFKRWLLQHEANAGRPL
ncbi:MAG: methylated-DNA--[protein]-cysteine S-methyltransferase [Gammaproteobacteria bacterium]|nr:methylated-DNA--[protein]-cysteine S-methyltransferase [Gammaproteobacteria bacterium]